MATVRRAEQEDVDALRALMLEYIVDFYGWPRPDDDDLLELIETMLEGREGFQLVAEDTGSLVGFTTVYLTWETLTPGRMAIMNDLFVAESERGSGVAADLFRAAADEARARGCRSQDHRVAQGQIGQATPPTVISAEANNHR